MAVRVYLHVDPSRVLEDYISEAGQQPFLVNLFDCRYKFKVTVEVELVF